MDSDLGIQGAAILLIGSLVFGGIVQLIARHVTRWMWLVGALGWFAGGWFVSEVMFAGVTEQEVQPVIDGLAFDESLFGGLVVGLVAVIATWLLVREGRSHRRTAA